MEGAITRTPCSDKSNLRLDIVGRSIKGRPFHFWKPHPLCLFFILYNQLNSPPAPLNISLLSYSSLPRKLSINTHNIDATTTITHTHSTHTTHTHTYTHTYFTINHLPDYNKMSSPKSFRKVEPAPTNFLSLAPSTSESYPSVQDIKPAGPRRSSSTSTSSETKSLRFLKLGPVHWGEHPDEHKEDWHEVTNEVAVE